MTSTGEIEFYKLDCDTLKIEKIDRNKLGKRRISLCKCKIVIMEILFSQKILTSKGEFITVTFINDSLFLKSLTHLQ